MPATNPLSLQGDPRSDQHPPDPPRPPRQEVPAPRVSQHRSRVYIYPDDSGVPPLRRAAALPNPPSIFSHSSFNGDVRIVPDLARTISSPLSPSLIRSLTPGLADRIPPLDRHSPDNHNLLRVQTNPFLQGYNPDYLDHLVTEGANFQRATSTPAPPSRSRDNIDTVIQQTLRRLETRFQVLHSEQNTICSRIDLIYSKSQEVLARIDTFCTELRITQSILNDLREMISEK